jgi:hypothetical protein
MDVWQNEQNMLDAELKCLSLFPPMKQEKLKDVLREERVREEAREEVKEVKEVGDAAEVRRENQSPSLDQKAEDDIK